MGWNGLGQVRMQVGRKGLADGAGAGAGKSIALLWLTNLTSVFACPSIAPA